MLDAFRCALPFQRLLGRAGLRSRGGARGSAGPAGPAGRRDLRLAPSNVVLRAMGQAQSSVRAARGQAGQGSFGPRSSAALDLERLLAERRRDRRAAGRLQRRGRRGRNRRSMPPLVASTVRRSRDCARTRLPGSTKIDGRFCIDTSSFPTGWTTSRTCRTCSSGSGACEGRWHRCRPPPG